MADRTPTATDIIVDEISEWAPMHVYWLGEAERIVDALDAAGYRIVPDADTAALVTEARRLVANATPGPWAADLRLGYFTEADAELIAAAPTLITRLADALHPHTQPDRCPTCGSDNPQFVRLYDAWEGDPIPCTDRFHTPGADQ